MRGTVMTIAFAIALSAGAKGETPNDYSSTEVELTRQDLWALHAAPSRVLNATPSDTLRGALNAAEVKKTRVKKFEKTRPATDVGTSGAETHVTYQARIHYAPIEQSDTRLHKPIVLCVAHGEKVHWKHCQDESWTRLQTASMQKPIRFNGDLTDTQIDDLFEYIDGAGLVLESSGHWVTTDSVFQIIKHEHAGDRINVYVSTGEKSSEVFYLRHFKGETGANAFQVTTFICGDKEYGRTVSQIAALSEPEALRCGAARP